MVLVQTEYRAPHSLFYDIFILFYFQIVWGLRWNYELMSAIGLWRRVNYCLMLSLLLWTVCQRHPALLSRKEAHSTGSLLFPSSLLPVFFLSSLIFADWHGLGGLIREGVGETPAHSGGDHLQFWSQNYWMHQDYLCQYNTVKHAGYCVSSNTVLLSCYLTQYFNQWRIILGRICSVRLGYIKNHRDISTCFKCWQ